MRFRWRYLTVAFVAVTAIAVLMRGEGGEGPGSSVAPPASEPRAVADEAAAIEDRSTTDAAEGTRSSSLAPPGVVGVGGAVSPLTDRSRQGALSSAMFFLELSEEVVQMSPEDGATIQRRYATRATAESTAAEISSQLASLRSAAGPGMRLDVAPISWTVTEIEPQITYAVSVWYVEVFSLGGPTDDAHGSFKTFSARVEWEIGSWKLGEAEAFDGPQPVVSAEGAATGFELRGQLSGFSDGGQLLPLLLAVQGEGDQ